MKKILSSMILLLGILTAAKAAPAIPGKFRHTQPDGTVIVLENHGDEYDHWLTDEQGRVVKKGPDGFYRPVGQSLEMYRAIHARPRPERRGVWASYDSPRETNFGDRKVLCIIANFSDSTFTLDNPRQRFSNMLNQAGYSYNGAIGSVRDYYIDNSMGQYRPQFDVYGPATLTRSSKYYDDNGVYQAILEAYEQLKSQIPIDDYDTDGDGSIDMVLFYYPGHNEAEGADEEAIWPHQSTGYFGDMGSKHFVRYFCTSEFRGSRGTEMCGIGTTCHEFGHSLGLPDFYDTDYATNGQNSLTTDVYDLMASGNYNDRGRRPPYLGAMERHMLGWMEAPAEITETLKITLPAIQNNQAWKTTTAVPGEYFIYECRNNEGWDSGTPLPGMIVYHVDQSERIVGSGYSAAYLWNNTNKINAFGGHPCYALYTSVSPVSYYDDLVFPGTSGKTSLAPLDWDGNGTGVSLSGITYAGGQVTFKAIVSSNRILQGRVLDSSGNPLSGVEMVLSRAAFPFAAAPGLLQNDLVTHTEADGSYVFAFPMNEPTERILSVRLDGYVAAAANLELDERYNEFDFRLLSVGEPVPGTLMRFSTGNGHYSSRISNFTSGAFGALYTADQINALGYAGGKIESITFAANASTYDRCYVIVEFGSERVLTKDVTDLYEKSSWIEVDVSGENLVIPADTPVRLAWGMTGLNISEYHMICFQTEENNGGICYTRDLNSTTSWGKVNFGEGVYRETAIMARVSVPVPVTLSNFGVGSIRIVDDYPVFFPPDGKTLKGVSWTMLEVGSPIDPQPLSTLSSGTHTWVATATYYDGTCEEVFYEVTIP